MCTIITDGRAVVVTIQRIQSNRNNNITPFRDVSIERPHAITRRSSTTTLVACVKPLLPWFWSPSTSTPLLVIVSKIIIFSSPAIYLAVSKVYQAMSPATLDGKHRRSSSSTQRVHKAATVPWKPTVYAVQYRTLRLANAIQAYFSVNSAEPLIMPMNNLRKYKQQPMSPRNTSTSS